MPLWSWLEASAAAQAVQESVFLTGFLSALHAMGMTVLTGFVIVSALQLSACCSPTRRRARSPGLRAAAS